MYRNRKILDLARDQVCQAIGCWGSPDTVVAAHSNWGRHGKGMGIKAHDCFVAYLCHECHTWVDQGNGSATAKLDVWYGAHESSISIFKHLLNDEARQLLANDRP